MAFFGCLICTETFSAVNEQNQKPKAGKGCPVLTSCGHYFDLLCLEKALVHERETIIIQNCGPLRKSCPACGKNLLKTKLTKINPLNIQKKHDGTNQNANSGVSNLVNESEYNLSVENGFHLVQIGDRVIYKSSKTGCENRGTVTDVLVEMQLDECDDQSNEQINKNKSKIITAPIQNVRIHNDEPNLQSETELFEVERNLDVFGVSPDSGIFDTDTEENTFVFPDTDKFPGRNLSPISRGPKWIAGDRIYLTNERKHATIKWIGSREFTFMAVIEYESPIDDDPIDYNDLPFSANPENRQRQRKLTLGELNEYAKKASNSSSPNLLSRFRRWGSERLPRKSRKSQTSLSSAEGSDGVQNYESKSLSRSSSSASSCTNSLMSIAEFKINAIERSAFEARF